MFKRANEVREQILLLKKYAEETQLIVESGTGDCFELALLRRQGQTC